MEAERLKEFAARRAGILSMSSAWAHDDDAALLNQLLAHITDLEAQLAARDAEIAEMKRNVARHCTNYAPCYRMLAARPTNGDR